MPRRRELVDPHNPRPRLVSPSDLGEEPFGPRAVSEQQTRPPVPVRLIGFGVFMVVAVALLAVNLYVLQVTQGQHFASLAEGNRVREETVLAPRGIIFDRHGVQLVQNVPTFAAAIVPVDLPKKPDERGRELFTLSKLVGVSVDAIESDVAAHKGQPFQPFVIKKNIDTATYQAVQENLPAMPGVRLITDTARHYVSDAGLSHILGYVGKLDAEEYKELSPKGYLLDDQVGKTGLELHSESSLRGTSGQRVVETNAQGQVVRELSTTPAVAGDNVYLSIDANLQRQTSKALQFWMDTQHTKLGGDRALAGAAIVMNPQSGEIYALVSLPDYDVNQFADGITQTQYNALINDKRLPLLDRAIGGVYPPGSTFKPVTAVAALQNGNINRGSSIFCPGHLTRGTFNFLCWNTSPGHGNQNVVDAIAHSCDVFFYTVADQMGDKILSKFAADFGVGKRSGIDLAGEAKGVRPDRDWKKVYFADAYQSTNDPAWLDSYWYEGNTITYGIGQSYLLVSPLQDLEWTATVANGGHFMSPRVVNRISSAGGASVQPFSPHIDHNVSASPEVLSIVREGLRAAASPGGTSGFLWNPKNFPQVANVPTPSGKTGTAQYGLPDAKGNLPEHSWYTAYAPAVDPEVAVVTFIEGGGEGHEGASPLATQILSYYFAHRDQIRATSSTPTGTATVVDWSADNLRGAGG